MPEVREDEKDVIQLDDNDRSQGCCLLQGGLRWLNHNMSYQPASAEDEKELLVVGVMSGTSGDGVDVAVVGISPGVARSTGEGSKGGGGGGSWVPPTVSLRGFRTVPFTEETRKLLFQLFSQSLTLAEVCDANFELGRVFGHAVLGTLQELGIPPTEVDLVASHGQTIYHNPPHSTLQIGEAAVIAELVGVTVVGDFRVADVAAGGQGAPITSTVDSMLLASPDGWRAVQNIGGFGNVTFVPPRTQPPITTGEGARQRELRQPIAFDTGPGNALLDWVVDRLTNGVQQYLFSRTPYP